MPATNPAERSQIASIAALTRWSKEDPTPTAIRAQRGLLAKFEREVDPDGTLAPAERTKRAERARRAHMRNLARKSAAKRKKPSTMDLFRAAADQANVDLAGGEWRTLPPLSQWTDDHGNVS